MTKIFELDKQFILANIHKLIELEDYVPFDFRIYGFEKERDEFLESKSLLRTIREMDKLVNEKCKHYKHPILAHDSIMIEWLNLHPEFKGIISQNSIDNYNKLINNNEFIEFIDFLYATSIPNEKTPLEKNKRNLPIGWRESSIPLPNFKKIDEIYDTFPNTLLADYLAYLV